MSDEFVNGETFWDDYAPYGTHGYSFGRGEEVTDWRVRRQVQFLTPRSTVCIGLGVAELADGRVYRYSIRRENHALANGRRRVAHRQFHGTFEALVRQMWENEREYIDPDHTAWYQAQVDAL